MIWVGRKQDGVWLWMLLTLHSLYCAESQRDGFISIDCGATANSTDPNTGIEWSTDEYYISTGVNRFATYTPISLTNVPQLQTLRYFPEKRSKHCYTLPTAQNSSYLLRAVFFYGDFQPLTLNYDFYISVDSTVTEYLIWDEPDLPLSWQYEFMFASTSDRINFCLQPNRGQPFINTLELRPLAEGMYDVVFNRRYLRMRKRENSGAQPEDPPVRYPDDPYDRLWYSPPAGLQLNRTNSFSKVSVPNEVFDRPPLKVMQDAFINSTGANSSFFWDMGLRVQSSAVVLYVNFFFAEVGTDDDSTDGSRVMNIRVSGIEFKSNITLSKETQHANEKSLNLPVGSLLNFEFYRQPGSMGGGPLLNAGELYESRPVVSSKTDGRDVSALEAVKSNLGLSSWTGDPCFPVPYDWLSCGPGGTARITQITLSKMDLVGTIPTSIAELTALTDLKLDNNNISGGIPDLSAMVDLKVLHLQNNALSGGIPTTLASLTFLTELFLSNNQLSGPIPAELADREGLNIQTSGNNRLCEPTENCPILPIGNDTFVENRNSTDTGSGGSGVSAAVIGGVVGGGVVVIVVIFLLWRKCRQRSTIPEPQKPPPADYNSDPIGPSHMDTGLQSFTLAELEEATEGFRKCIGNGGYGPVFYGVLPGQSEIAVKRNSERSSQGTTEFVNEVTVLSRGHHKNLVSLIGYCVEGGNRMLVYEFMDQGTLQDHLYGEAHTEGKTQMLSWRERLEIGLDAAEGLKYLHFDCIIKTSHLQPDMRSKLRHSNKTPKLIHRDIKSTNILLAKSLDNDKFLAKVADFGIMKLIPGDDTSSGSTLIKGTRGYLDPQYCLNQRLTQKSDVYSFGVVLLEIICARPPLINATADADEFVLSSWAQDRYKAKDLESMVDPAIKGQYNKNSMLRVAALAMSCIEPHDDDRPDMQEVVRALTKAVHEETNVGRKKFFPGGGDERPKERVRSSQTQNSATSDTNSSTLAYAGSLASTTESSWNRGSSGHSGGVSSPFTPSGRSSTSVSEMSHPSRTPHSVQIDVKTAY